jgi:hypothetical protein
MTAPILLAAAPWRELLPYLPLAVGAGVGLAVLLLLGVRGRRPAVADDGPVSLSGSDQWRAAEASYSDRRSSVRREGAPIKILVSSPAFQRGQDCGYVLDRSTGGLRIALGTAVAAGTSLLVRATHAPDTVPWVTVLVRSCKHTGQHHELGCEFEKTPPWNVLLLFG